MIIVIPALIILWFCCFFLPWFWKLGLGDGVPKEVKEKEKNWKIAADKMVVDLKEGEVASVNKVYDYLDDEDLAKYDMARVDGEVIHVEKKKLAEPPNTPWVRKGRCYNEYYMTQEDMNNHKNRVGYLFYVGTKERWIAD